MRGDQELIPLSVAATVAYFDRAESRFAVERAQERAVDAVRRAAIMLGERGALHRRLDDGSATPMSRAEIEAVLVRPLRAGEAADLDSFFIRRGDLHAAIEALRRSGAAPS